MIEQSITLGDGLMTLTAQFEYDGVYGTTDHVISTLTYINEQRVNAGLRPLTWEVV